MPKRIPITETKAPKIKKDPIAEYKEALVEKNVVEVLTLANDDCLATVKLHISTQSLELDRLFNGKGIPTGRVVELYGPPHIGKSTLLDHLFASVQNIGGIAILFDTEGARDIRYTQSIGVDPSKLLLIEFKPTELHIENVMSKIFQTIEFWAKEYPETPVVLGWDALGGTATRDELEKRMDKESQPARAAQIMRKACRQLPSKLGNTNISLVIANHEYLHFSMGGGFGGSKKETYGGEAVRHLATLRAQLYPVGWVKRADGQIVGREIGVKLVKNRLGNPWGEARIALISGIGIDNTWSVFNKLKEAGIITVSGSWAAINLDGELIKFQGWLGLTEKCKDDDTLFPRLVSIYKGLP